MHWRQALTEYELLDREQQTKNQAQVIRMIKSMPKLQNTDIEVDENRVKLLWKGDNEDFVNITFTKKGEVFMTTEEEDSSVYLDIGPFMGEELYNYVTRRKY
jgi:hypothetical protein